MLERKLRNMVKEHGRVATRQTLLEKIEKLNKQMLKAPGIYHAIDIEHDILDCQTMLKWLKESKEEMRDVD